MKTILSLSAILITLALTAQTNTATWYLNDTSGNGIQSPFGNTATGGFSTSVGQNTTASGYASTAMGLGTTASGENSTAIGFYTTASGDYSTAMGRSNTASGRISTTMGNGTTASGYASTAMGHQTTASGDRSTAMGQQTTASGIFSTASGYNSTADGFITTVIGSYNTVDENSTPNYWSYSNRAFVIGNGGWDSEGNFTGVRSDALTVLFDGTTNVAGSVTATEFIGDGSQLTNLPSSSPFFEYIDGSISALGASASGGSFAVGDVAYSSGYNSRALGVDTIASGDGSTAIGFGGIASGNTSTAIGAGATASGDVSTALGYRTIASDRSSLVVGRYNLLGSTVTNSATAFSTDNTAFVIGNGTNADNRSDALTVLFDGTTNFAGSVTATEFIGDGSQLTNLPSSSPFSYNETSGGGIQSSSNIASGYASTAYGNYTTASGRYSKATGDRTVASGEASIAMGNRTIASGDYSTAIGNRTKASGELSTAVGYQTTASGHSSTAMGAYTTASGNYSTAMGYQTTASGSFSTALGDRTVASGINSIVLGVLTEASGDYSTAMGTSTTANGDYSTAMGTSTTAEDYLSLAIGVLNKSDESPNPNSFSYQNTAFVIGNGGHDSEGNYVGTSETFSNAFEVLFDGTTTIAGDLSINSDARLKANIISLGSTLAKLLQIDGKTYTMKKDENKKQKIGVLAQDIEKVFPELVSESNGVKSVNYQGLVPVLINALKEQQAEIDRLKTQEERLDRLERLVAAMDLK
jgi:hypothetical protein